jgi:predicted LPLAT superfamily acyltransferase
MSAAQANRAAEWAARAERSNLLALRLMAWIALRLGRRVARGLLHPITLYFLCFAPAPRRHSARFLARALGRPPSWPERYRHLHHFASVVLDRVYFVRGHTELFDIAIEGQGLLDAALAEGRGAVLLGAHVGSFEALHAISGWRPGTGVAMAMFPDNARKIQGVLQALAPDFKLHIIAIGRSGSSLAIRDWLDQGGLVGLLGDRFLASEGAAAGCTTLPFLGTPAHFSDGPLRLAQLLRRQVIFMSGLYCGGNRYQLRFQALADFRSPAVPGPPAEPGAREARVQQALQAYVSRLEALARERPDNWFNFYDYWCEEVEPTATATATLHG